MSSKNPAAIDLDKALLKLAPILPLTWLMSLRICFNTGEALFLTPVPISTIFFISSIM